VADPANLRIEELMKIRLTKNKKSLSVRFSAENDTEGVDLKDVVLGMAKGANAGMMTRAIEDLGKRGYTGDLTKETASTKQFTVRKAKKAE
jgi:hypothetical protein